MVFPPLNEQQLDALREISNVGMGHAATALSQLTGKTVHLEVPRLMLTDMLRIPEELGNAEQTVVGISLLMLGNAQGHILIVFPWDNAVRMLESLLSRKRPEGTPLSEMELSALNELGNILASAYLNALGEMLNMTLIPSVPHLCVNDASTVIANTLTEFAEVGGATLMLDTEFFSKDERVSGQFFLLPASASLEVILTALGMATR